MAQSEADIAKRVHEPVQNMVDEMLRDRIITHEEAATLKTGAVHVTRYGLCRHDFSLMPCPYDMNCINCAENVFVAHDSRMVEEARSQVRIQNNALIHCRKAIDRGEPGVEYYLKMHTRKLARWERALQLMTDPGTEPGTIISLPSVSSTAEEASGNESETPVQPGHPQPENQTTGADRAGNPSARRITRNEEAENEHAPKPGR